MNARYLSLLAVVGGLLWSSGQGRGEDIKQTKLYERIKASLDAVPAIDTHDHLPPRDKLFGLGMTPRGRGMTLHTLWSVSYFPGLHKVAPWPADGNFDEWWRAQQPNFVNARATSFYRYLLPAFRDLYGVDFDTITLEQARALNEQIFKNYKSDKWIEDVVTRRANIELMVVDPYWARLQFDRAYRFTVPLLNVTTIMSASHPERFRSRMDSPYAFAESRKLKTETFDDYLKVIDAIFVEAVANDCVCLKSTQAYQRTLQYDRVPKERAAAAYRKPPKQTTPQEQKDFEDFMFWHVCQLSAKYELPFQVHTGQARIQGSNPMLLVDLIQANPQTKFILFHGGYPWVGETAVIGMKLRNVWIDSVWLPTLSQTMARRAYQEWLDAVPSNRIMWGADCANVEGIYGATAVTRQCLAEALAEKVERGELREEDALRVGRQILRENALEIFPKLRRWLWRKETDAKGQAAMAGNGDRRVTATAAPSPQPSPGGRGSEAPAGKLVALRGKIIDADTRQLIAARLYMEGPAGEWHIARPAADRGSAVPYRKGYGKQSLEVHTALSADPFVAELPHGQYTLTAERGKEYLPASVTVDLEDKPAEVTIKIKRFVDMQRLGWYSGETHVHRRLAELPTAMLADDLNVTLPITYWATKSDTAPQRADKQPDVIEPKLVEIDPTHVYWPLNAEYEIFKTRGKDHTQGAVFALNLKEPLKLGVPPVRNLAEEVRRQGGLLELDKHNWNWSMMIVPQMQVDLYELSNNHVWRTNFHWRRWANPAPTYMKVEQDAGGVTENGWIDFTMQNYYCLLDCGFRLRPTAGTASGVHPVPLGYGRVYVHVPGEFSYDAWLKGLNAGESFVTTGPLMDVKLDGQLPGHTLKQIALIGDFSPGPRRVPCRLSGWIYSAGPLETIEIIAAGQLARTVKPQNTPMPGGGNASRVDELLPLHIPTWYALRAFEPTGDGRRRFAHSAPWYIDVPGRPLRPRPEEIAYLIARVEAEIKRNTGVLSEASLAEYREALATYRKILSRK